MAKLAGIHWAPVNIPFERRMQTLAVIHFFACFILMPIFCIVVPIYIVLYTSYWYVDVHLWFNCSSKKLHNILNTVLVKFRMLIVAEVLHLLVVL